MKNYDLIWAREWAGLTQSQAADKMGVHRVTFTQWETGARPIPARKWQLFLKRVAVNPRDIPKRLQYDSEGYPVGFELESYRDMAIDIASYIAADGTETFDDEFGWDLEEASLMELEGDDYDARSRERAVLRRVKSYINHGTAAEIEEVAKKARAEWTRWELYGSKESLLKAAAEWRRWKSSGSKGALENAKAEWRRCKAYVSEADRKYAAALDLL